MYIIIYELLLKYNNTNYSNIIQYKISNLTYINSEIVNLN